MAAVWLVACFSFPPASLSLSLSVYLPPSLSQLSFGLPTRGLRQIEALGAIHFAPAAFRTGDKGVKPDQLFLELGIHGADGKAQVENLGIR